MCQRGVKFSPLYKAARRKLPANPSHDAKIIVARLRRPQVVRYAHCVLFNVGGGATPCRRARLRLEPRTRGGGENRPMGREAHPRKSQCTLLSPGYPPTSPCRVFRREPARLLLLRSFHPGGNPRVGSNRGDPDRATSAAPCFCANTTGVERRRKIYTYTHPLTILPLIISSANDESCEEKINFLRR